MRKKLVDDTDAGVVKYLNDPSSPGDFVSRIETRAYLRLRRKGKKKMCRTAPNFQIEVFQQRRRRYDGSLAVFLYISFASCTLFE